MEVAAVKFALGKLNVLLNMGLELYHVSDEVTGIQQKLGIIQGFLQDAHSKRNQNPAVKQWVNAVRGVAYRIEDAIDTFLVDIENNRVRNSGVCSKLVRLKKPLKVKNLVDEVKKIRSTLEDISQTRIELGITDASGSSPQFDGELSRPARPSDVDDSEVVGLDREKQEIIDQLLDTNILRRTVLSIVGIGGLGKTTLAQKVYKSDELEGEGRFDCRIWLSISQNRDVQYLLREILFSVEPNMRQENPTISHEDLTRKLRESLYQRRYLIVLDDVWTVDLWESLKIALPDGDNASRVLITTRILDVARAADGNSQPYELRHLNEDESLTLLFQKANIPIEGSGVQRYRTDLNEVARQLTKKCAYLPLALDVLGRFLSTRERTRNAWQRVNDTLDWHDEETRRCSEVLLLSYVDLPYNLKPCFLYFASFPEDHRISAEHVIRMWISEGFIPRDGRGSMEQRAENFLEKLLHRGLVQVMEKSWNGKCKICGVHDLIRDMAIHEAREENFFTVFTEEDDGIQLSAQKVRRAMLQCSPTNFSIQSKNARSLLLFGSYDHDYELNISGFRLLKVLSIEGVDLRYSKIIHKNRLEGLTHLRYLGIRNCHVSIEFFTRISFRSLMNLETIYLKGTTVYLHTKMCNKLRHYLWQGNHLRSLWKVPSLRHVITGNLSVPLPSEGDDLRNIQTLKLRIVADWKSSIEERWKNVKAMLTRTEHLISLSLTSQNEAPLLSEGTRDLSCHETIRNLFLWGKWDRDLCVLNLEMLPTNLTKLTLGFSILPEDPMPILERLQSLTILRLLDRSFTVTELTCTDGGFPSLKKLEFRSPYYQTCIWDIREGAMPELNHLIVSLPLQVFPELQNVPWLQTLELDERLYAKSALPENLYKIRHIRSVRKLKRWSD